MKQHEANMDIPHQAEREPTFNEVLFEVPGKPVPKARPRVTIHGTYTPEATRTHTEWVQAHALQAMLGRLLIPKGIGVEMRVEFYRKRKIPARPDLVNYIAVVADALQGIVYADDSQIINLTAFVFPTSEERTWIRVRALER